MGRPKKYDNALCHSDRPHYARGLCKPCYDHKRWTGNNPHGVDERGIDIELAAGLAQVPRAGRKPESETSRIRYQNPQTAELLAKAALKHGLDMEQAVMEIKPDLTPAQAAQTAHTLENAPQVKAAIEKALQKRGLDDKSKGRFVEILWRYAESTDSADEKKTLAAWRILGRGFIGEKIDVSRPEELRISGFDEGIRRMMSEDDGGEACGQSDVPAFQA